MKYKSKHFDGRHFHNPVPTEVMGKDAFFRVMRKWFQHHPGKEPASPLGPFSISEVIYSDAPDKIRVTWLGHSSTILEIDGKRFLTDPLWYQRASPFTHMGPKRFFQPPAGIDELPAIDHILLSHDHYDHLDKGTILQLTRKNIPVITMLGVGQRLLRWGVEKTLVTELDWWDSITTGDGYTITAAPARHFSGRWLNDRFTTLWGSFAIRGPLHNVYYGADSGYYNGFSEIGERLGPFDLTMLEIGAYNEDWEAIHMGPENAVQAHLDAKGKILMPIHWGTFGLAFHPWKEPAERILAAAEGKALSLLMPAPGETVEVKEGGYINKWWDAY